MCDSLRICLLIALEQLSHTHTLPFNQMSKVNKVPALCSLWNHLCYRKYKMSSSMCAIEKFRQILYYSNDVKHMWTESPKNCAFSSSARKA